MEADLPFDTLISVKLTIAIMSRDRKGAVLLLK